MVRHAGEHVTIIGQKLERQQHTEWSGRDEAAQSCKSQQEQVGTATKSQKKSQNDRKIFRNSSKFGRKPTEEFEKNATWTAEEPKSVPKACPKTALCTTQDPQGSPRRVTRVFFPLGFWHLQAIKTRPPPRKNNDFGCFGDVRNGLAQQGTQRHDKHVRPPAGATAGLVQHAGRAQRAADSLRFASPAEAT